MTWFETLVKAVDKADLLVDAARERLGKPPRKRLHDVPEPIGVKDPFAPVAARPKAAAAPSPAAEAPAPVPSAVVEDPPLGNPALAAQLFGRRTDPESGRALALLREHGVDAVFVNLDEPENELFEKQLIRETKAYVLPYVYLRGEYVGGHDEIAARAKKGELG